ncbi:hypothetical protein P8452_70865 [Trifolium repens]|nr:hypothetical protein P8452_70865 [Trifolium repens]
MQIKQVAPKPILPDAWTNIQNMGKSSDFSNPMRFSKSNYRRDLKSRTMEEDFQSLNGISKKLFESHFSTPTTTAQGKKGSSSTKGKKTMFGSASVSAKRSRSVLPKGIKWNFQVTSDMKLDLAELQAIAYVYHPEKDKSERLVKSRGIEAYRADFDTLTPGQMINHKIVTLVCMRANWVQRKLH